MMSIFININDLLKEYDVHGEHECDLYDYLKIHQNKKELSKKHIIEKYNHIRKETYTQRIEYFYINPTEEDIEYILNTCWFRNKIWDNKELKEELTNTEEIKVLIIE